MLFQTRINGREGIDAFNTFEASSMDDAISQCLSALRLEHSLKGNQESNLEEIRLLLKDDSKDTAREKIELELSEALREIRDIADAATSSVGLADISTSTSLLNSIRDKLNKTYGLLSAFAFLTEQGQTETESN